MFADSGILISFPSGFDQVSIKKKQEATNLPPP
jgi:hypothetical protein